ncbi:MAG TPA: polyprenol phosphomannose-dependent alpha 1,6 mannosyltransferase MptB [Acidimicrobiales bacterium]|nr:polyprenol phosphomannose-dependent alpha 1,6 mannosyltransferase MptB [Acidimicrobiales bacterium]
MTSATIVARRLDSVPIWASVLLGVVGSVGVALSAASIGSTTRPGYYRWWLRLPHIGYVPAHVLLYVGVALLVVGWLGLGVVARRGDLGVARCWAALVSWGLPLLAGAPAFSRDVYSYAAQGELTRHGLNPYTVAPSALVHGPLYYSLAEVWRDTTSPYGPLFLALSHASAAVAGHSLIAQVLTFRALELVGVILLMLVLPLLARHFNADPGVALWLGALSPLALFSAISSAHNDTLMLGLLALAIMVALKGRRRWALVLFAVAATVKLPALAGAVIFAARDLRAAPRGRRAQLVGEALVIPAVVIAAITEAVGLGWAWLSPSALRIPTELRVLTTPVVSLGVFSATLARGIGIDVANHAMVTAVQYVGGLAVLALLVMLVLRVRGYNTVRLLGVALLVVVVGSPTLWPWYLLWGLTVLGVTSAQRSRSLAVVAGGAMLLVGAGGTPMIGGNGFLLSGPLVLAGLWWLARAGRWPDIMARDDRVH